MPYKKAGVFLISKNKNLPFEIFMNVKTIDMQVKVMANRLPIKSNLRLSQQKYVLNLLLELMLYWQF